MADITQCDLCGKSPANRVEVGIVLTGVAGEGLPTGSSEAVDACESCQHSAVEKLVSHVKETLAEQVPFHAKLHGPDGVNERMDRVNVALAATTEAMLAHERSGRDADALAPRVKNEHESNLISMAELTEERHTLLGEAQELHEKRIAAFRKSLKPRTRR